MALEENQNGTVVQPQQQQQKDGGAQKQPQLQPSTSSEKLNAALANGTNEKTRNNNKQVSKTTASPRPSAVCIILSLSPKVSH